MTEISSIKNVKKECTILIDTFCSTGCEYCNMHSLKKNPAVYGFEKILPFLKTFEPNVITIFGGDTFYDEDQIKKVTNTVLQIPTLLKIQSVSEITKLERDLDIRTWLYQQCVDNNIQCGVEFSLDLKDKKSGDFYQILSEFCKRNNPPVVTLISVITSEQLMSGELPELYDQLIQTYTKCEHGIFFTKISLDYNSIHKKTTGIEQKINEFLDSIKFSHNVIPHIFTKNYCKLTDGKGISINQKAELVMCSYTGYKHDITPISLLDENITYQQIKQSIFDFKKQSGNDVCKACEARELCNNCIKVQNNAVIDGTQDTCIYYKHLYKKQQMLKG